MRKFVVLAGSVFFLLASLSAQKLTGWDKKDWKRNIISIEFLGGSGIAGVHYERVFPVGRLFSFRAHVGVSPFYMDEKYNFYAGKNITGMVGGGFYIFPKAIKLGIGCTVLNDIFFDRIPETVVIDSTGHPIGDAGRGEMYRVRVMPYLSIETYFSRSFFVRAAYTPIFDPPNNNQTELFVTHIGAITFGFKFGK